MKILNNSELNALELDIEHTKIDLADAIKSGNLFDISYCKGCLDDLLKTYFNSYHSGVEFELKVIKGGKK